MEGCCAGRVCLSISRVSDLRRIILYSRWRVGTPTRRPLEVSLRWHLSVSGQPSVAPSISLADSRELGASLYSFTSSAGHCPAGTRPGPFSRTLPNTLMEHTHTHTGKHFTESHSPWTRLEKWPLKSKLKSKGNASLFKTKPDVLFCTVSSSLSYFFFPFRLLSTLSVIAPSPLLSPSLLPCLRFPPPCPLRSMVNLCRPM